MTYPCACPYPAIFSMKMHFAQRFCLVKGPKYIFFFAILTENTFCANPLIGWLLLFPGELWTLATFLVGCGWLLLFSGGLQMLAIISWWTLDGYCYFVISWWALDGRCYFLVGSGWSLLFPSGLWMVAVIGCGEVLPSPYKYLLGWKHRKEGVQSEHGCNT